MKLWEENSIKSYYRVLPSFVWSRVLVVVFVSLTDVLLFVSLFFFAGFSFTGWYFVDVHQRPLMACDWTTSRRVVLRRRRRRSRPPRIRPAVLVSFSMFCFVFFGPTPPSRTPETHTHTHTHTHTPTQKEKGRPTLVVIHWRASSQIPRRDRRFVLEPNPKKQQQQQQTNKVCEMADPSSRRASVGLLRRKTKKPNKQRRIGPKSATWFDCRPLDGARHVSAPSARFFTAATSWISAMIQWTTASRGRSIIEHPASDDYGPISAGVSYRKQRPNQAKANTVRFEKPKQFDSVMLLLVTVHWTWRPSNMAGLCV